MATLDTELKPYTFQFDGRWYSKDVPSNSSFWKKSKMDQWAFAIKNLSNPMSMYGDRIAPFQIQNAEGGWEVYDSDKQRAKEVAFTSQTTPGLAMLPTAATGIAEKAGASAKMQKKIYDVISRFTIPSAVTAEGLTEEAINTATFGSGNEISAFVRSLPQAIEQGKLPWDTPKWKKYMGASEERLAQSRINDPWKNVAAAVAGGGVYGLPGAAASLGVQTVKGTQRLMAQQAGRRFTPQAQWSAAPMERASAEAATRSMARRGLGYASLYPRTSEALGVGGVPPGFVPGKFGAHRSPTKLSRHFYNVKDWAGPSVGIGAPMGYAYGFGSGRGDFGERSLGGAEMALYGALAPVVLGGGARGVGHLSRAIPATYAGLKRRLAGAPKKTAEFSPEIEEGADVVAAAMGEDVAVLQDTAYTDLGAGRGVVQRRLHDTATTLADEAIVPPYGTGDHPAATGRLAASAMQMGPITPTKQKLLMELEARSDRMGEAVVSPIQHKAVPDIAKVAKAREKELSAAATPLYREAYGQKAIPIDNEWRAVMQSDASMKDAFSAARALRQSEFKPGGDLDINNPFDHMPTIEEALGGYRALSGGYFASKTDDELKAIAQRLGLSVRQYRKVEKGEELGRDHHAFFDLRAPEGGYLSARDAHGLMQGYQAMAGQQTLGSIRRNYEDRVRDIRDKFFGHRTQRKAQTAGEQVYRVEEAEDIGKNFFNTDPKTGMTFVALKRNFNRDSNDRVRTKVQKDALAERAWQAAVGKARKEGTDMLDGETVKRMEFLFQGDKVGFQNWLASTRAAKRFGITQRNVNKRSFFDTSDEKRNLGQLIGLFAKRTAEFAFSVPFAAARALDRALTRGKFFSDKVVRDAVLELLLATGAKRDSYARLINSRIQKLSQVQKVELKTILKIALGGTPIAEDITEAPGVRHALKGAGMGGVKLFELGAGLIR